MGNDNDEKVPRTPETLYDESQPNTTAQDKEVGHTTERQAHSRASITNSEQSTIAEPGTRDVENLPLERVATERKPVVKVPRSQRRGLFARFALLAEVTEPYDYPNKKKWFITFIVAISGAAAPIGSAIVFPTLDEIITDLHTTATIANLNVALYMLSMAIFPLWWSSFSEAAGRRTVYLTSFALYIVFGVLSAFAKSIEMLIVMRMLSGGAAASVQAVGAGTIADVWESYERGRAMGFFYLGPLCGPLLAPIIGGIVGESLGWRATQWALVIYGVLIWTFVFFALPETLKSRKSFREEANAEEGSTDETTTGAPLSRTSTQERVQKKSRKYARVARMMLLDPLKVITYLRFPPVLLTIYYASVTFGSLYVLNVSVQYSFGKPPYNFSTLVIGLLYIPSSVGYVLSSLFGGPWMDRIMKREAIKANRYTEDGKLIYRPEDRMRENAWLGALLYPACFIWYGWTVQKGVFWVVPIIANFFYGMASMVIFSLATTMLTEFMPQKSSSGVALNNLMRNIFSCTGGIIGVPLINAIGNGWLFTILGIWALCSASVIWAMRHYGPRWREQMDRELR